MRACGHVDMRACACRVSRVLAGVGCCLMSSVVGVRGGRLHGTNRVPACGAASVACEREARAAASRMCGGCATGGCCIGALALALAIVYVCAYVCPREYRVYMHVYCIYATSQWPQDATDPRRVVCCLSVGLEPLVAQLRATVESAVHND